MKKTNLPLKTLASMAIISVVLTGCGQKADEKKVEEKSITISTRKFSDSRVAKKEVEFPATVMAKEEAKIIAKTAGTATEVRFKVGDNVKIGDELVKIDDADKNIAIGSKNFNANQVKQAKIAVEQALSSFNIAQTNYQNLLTTSAKDLRQLEIARDQANTGKSNTGDTTSESYKSAELAYETAKLATEQAKISLDNRKSISDQTTGDTDTNIQTTLDSIANSCGTLIFSINQMISYDNKEVSVPYRYQLGQLDSDAYNNGDTAYVAADAFYESYRSKNWANTTDRINSTIQLAEKVKKMADTTKYLLEKTVSSTALPQTSTTGASLNGLLSSAAGYQTTANALLSSANGAKQSQANTDLNIKSTLDSLRKAYELAQKQEASALQNLNNLKAGNKSQLDQVGYGAESAENQYQSNKVKIETQVSVSKSQMEMASLQYQNAVVALESLYDAHIAISPIDGTVTKKLVESGDTVSAGQLLAVVSKLGEIKLQFYVDQETLKLISNGMQVFVDDDEIKDVPAKIIAINQQADNATKRFLVEVGIEKDADKLVLGSIMTVRIPVEKTPKEKDNLILPLSAINIGQNESYIYIVKDGRAEKLTVEIKRVDGEDAEITTGNADQGTEIIIDGAKLVQSGEKITIKNE